MTLPRQRILIELMDLAKVALGQGQVTDAEAARLLFGLVGIIEARMPEDLQAQDPRLVAAKALAKDVAHADLIPVMGKVH